MPDEVRFCDECKPPTVLVSDGIREHTFTDRVRYRRQYSSPRWQRLRNRVVREQPLCARCELRITEIVDHIVPAGVAVQQVRDSGRYPGDFFAGFFFRSNLQGLCRPCHLQKTIDDKAHVGEWPSVLEAEVKVKVKHWSF